MAVICPTVTVNTDDLHEYRRQMERVENLSNRIQVDLMDKEFTGVASPEIDKIWFPENLNVDLHLMYKNPADVLNEVMELKPKLLIVHAEAVVDIPTLAGALSEAGIRLGMALLQDTPVDAVKPHLEYLSHVLIFSGDLGHYGGEANLALLEKVTQLRAVKPDLEIGWDGGVSPSNAKKLAESGVDVLNAGGYIQESADPMVAFQALTASLL